MATVPVLNHWDVLANPIIQIKASQFAAWNGIAAPNAPVAVIGDSQCEGMAFPTLGGRPVLNMGFGGARLESIAYRAIGLLPVSGIHAAIVMCSINNAALGIGDPESINFSPDLSGLIASILPWTTRIALITITPFETYNPATMVATETPIDALALVPNIGRVNAVIEGVGAYYNKPVFDLSAECRQADGTAMPQTTRDQVHWTGNFYNNVAQPLFQRAAAAILA